MKLVLFEPDNPKNFGTILRTAVCFNAELHIIEPSGFPLDDKRIKNGALDYAKHIDYTRHANWQAFLDARQGGRLVLLTTQGATPLGETTLNENDWLILGRETAGVPDNVHTAADIRAIIPMREGMRSLNVAVTAGIVLWEANRQQSAKQTNNKKGICA